MTEYHTEGYVGKIEIIGRAKSVGLKFSINPSSPYVFEEKTADGKLDRKIILKDDHASAFILAGDTWFKMNGFAPPLKLDANSLLILKADKLKVRVCCEKAPATGDIDVSKIEIL